MDIKEKLQGLPAQPGVYLMMDREGEIIYVGKASSLKKRVSSYFVSSKRDPKTAVLAKLIADVDYIVTATEIEALILENNLIKKHKPRFNVRLKDDKRYPYIAVTLSETYPRVIFTRKIKRAEDKYFGPYTDAQATRALVSLVNRTFKLKTCNRPIPLKPHERPCLNYQMKRCQGICRGTISRIEYEALVKSAIKFLEGDIEPVLAELRTLMKRYANEMEYEKAARVRDVINDIVKLSSTQNMDLPSGVDQDFIGVKIEKGEGLVLLFEFRKGIMLGKKIRVFENAQYEIPAELLRLFIIEHYGESAPPPHIIASEKIPDAQLLEDYLTAKSHAKVRLSLARTKEEQAVIRLVLRNLDIVVAERAHPLSAAGMRKSLQSGLIELKDLLQLQSIPEIIECFDISNIHGKYSVASMVQFRNGIPEKSQYRRYKIRMFTTANDPGMIHEVVLRRLQHCINEGNEFPHLIVVDGGIAQLSKAIEAVNSLAIDVKVIAIAKRFDEIYIENEVGPLKLPENSIALTILKQIRDEAHRFALAYHRNLRDREAVHSIFDEIPGVGPERRKVLFRYFKTFDSIKNATIEMLCEVPGIGLETAKAIYDYFHRKHSNDVSKMQLH
ncbi:MAG: excinuclease ABC subunit UvrC [Spirochaetes bacterium]|nr:excinuclease ABC subunit UvrC [Spirochaetota bacterium]